MNNGFFGFSTPYSGSSVIEVKEFDSSGTYVIPTGAKRLWIMLYGAGGGGGSGARHASGTTTTGGSGAGGGTQNSSCIYTIALGGSLESTTTANPGFSPGSWLRTLQIIIGAGGNGGNAITTNSTNGNPGSTGGFSAISLSGTSGYMMYCLGGGAGSGGGTAGVGGGSSQSPIINGLPTVATNNISTGGLSSTTIPSNITLLGINNRGGAGGGGIDSGNASYSGAGISSSLSIAFSSLLNPNYDKGSVIKTGGSTGATSVVFNPQTVFGPYSPGLGGVGGGGSATTNANNGENGYRSGGGGGGGASRNGFNSGSGGVGGNGYCVIIALGI